MMMITANGKDYELSTSLQTLERIQTRLGKSATQIFSNMSEMTTSQQISLLSIAAGEAGKTLRDDILNDADNWGMFKVTESLTELTARMLFAGTDEEKERQINKAFEGDEKQKNEIKALLGIPQQSLDSIGGGNW